MIAHQMKRAAAKPPLNVEALDLQTSATNGTSYTFSGVSFGAVGAERYIVICVIAGVNSTLSATIGGVAATSLYEFTVSTTSYGFFGALVPTGTSGDIVVTVGATADRLFMGAWRVQYPFSITPTATVTDGDTDITVSCNAAGAILAFTYAGPIGGPLVASTAHDVFATAQVGLVVTATRSGTTVTWTNLTEDLEVVSSENASSTFARVAGIAIS